MNSTANQDQPPPGNTDSSFSLFCARVLEGNSTEENESLKSCRRISERNSQLGFTSLFAAKMIRKCDRWAGRRNERRDTYSEHPRAAWAAPCDRTRALRVPSRPLQWVKEVTHGLWTASWCIHTTETAQRNHSGMSYQGFPCAGTFPIHNPELRASNPNADLLQRYLRWEPLPGVRAGWRSGVRTERCGTGRGRMPRGAQWGRWTSGSGWGS